MNMNQMYGPGPRGNRGGRGHFQPGRYQNRYPHPNFKNQNGHQSNHNNNNPKCYNQNIERCPNPNMDQGEFVPPGDRLYANPGANAPYLGNEQPAYQLEPVFHGHGPPIVFDMPQYGQPHYTDLGIPPPMLPQMQMVNYSSPPPFVPPNVVYGMFSQAGMPPSTQMELFDTMKDVNSRSQSRESFGCHETGLAVAEDYIPQQTASCANCVSNETRTAETIRELQTDISSLQTKNRTLEEEVATLKIQLQAAACDKGGPPVRVEPTEIKTSLSVNAEPFVAKPIPVYESCTAAQGQSWPPDPVDQGYEKTCTELIEIIKDKPEETWTSPVIVPLPELTSEIPVVSANGITKWSEMLEADAVADAPLDYNSRGRVSQEDQDRLNNQSETRHGGSRGYYDNRHGTGPNPDSSDQSYGRGSLRKNNRGPPQHYQSRGLNSHQAPDRTGGFRQEMGYNGNRGGNRNMRGMPRSLDMNWRANSSKRPESRDGEPGNSSAGADQKRDDEKREVKEDERGDEKKSDVERPGERKPVTREESRERPKGGSGDRLRSSTNEPPSMQQQNFITEVDGDLFTVDPSFSLAHCVATDLQMGSGIAVTFRDKFKRVDELLDQHKRVGEVAILEDKNRFIYYLITKLRSQGKPRIEDLESSLWAMAHHCHAKGVKKLAMPRIGCGLDKLDWSRVKAILKNVFSKSGVEITVFNYPQVDERKDDATPRKKSSLHFVQEKKNLVNIETGTGLLYICSEDGTVTPAMESLDTKHHFLPNFRAAKRVCGDIVEIDKGNERLYGLVVKKTAKDPISYANLLSCLKKLRTKNNTAEFEYFGLEAFRDNGDELTMAKVATMIRNVFGGSKYKLEFWLCFPPEFVKDMDVPVPSHSS